EDKGAFELNKEDDYPDFIKLVTESVKKDDFGIILGGSGQGEAICANRYNQARSAVYYGGPRKIIKLARQHNNANILSLGARFISKRKAKKITKLFLETPFSNKERHVRRIKKLWK
ncbi:MAG: RpiB/LacA/LacB family sugar-phosphate isomerase, partial [Patescibacteria group bacterium]|nr:RpiB/LacA/LacB family sugar-phosphate isomerase [Patescibacteria group bacterium]